jgi:acyl-CoA dehydrogenase
MTEASPAATGTTAAAVAPIDFDTYLARVRALVDGRLIPDEPRLVGQETLPEDLTEELRRAALFGISIPRAYGGLGLTMEQQVRVMFEVTRASSVYRARFSTTIGLGSQPILYNGTEEQRREWLPRMASGAATAAFALTEPDHGSDAGSIATMARRDGGHFVIDGTKRYITNARQADVFVVMARTDPDNRGATGISAFIVPAGTPGLRCGPADLKMGQDGSSTSEVYFEGCRVPATALVGGREGGGFKTAMRGINHARLHVAVTCVGQAERLLAEALAHAMRRRQFGQALAEFQLVQGMLAESRAETLAARSMILETARLRPRRGGGGRHRRRHRLLQVLRLGDGLPRRRPCGAGARRRRLHARQRGGAVVPRRAGVPHLRGHLANPADDHRPRPAAAARAAGRR